jgi:cobalt-zinc-cadmium efflux system membrane fusion protein
VELDVFSRDLARIRSGQPVEIETFDGHRVTGTIDWVSPLAAHASQSVQARVHLANPDNQLRPGQFVRGRVTVSEFAAPLAVRKSAIQRFRDFQVVFARFGDTYEVRMVELGRSDDEWVEVLSGLAPGTEYVTANSYLIKADIEKSGASHDH